MLPENIDFKTKQNYKELMYFSKKGIHPFVIQYLCNRGITKREDIEKYIYGDINDLYDCSLIKDIDKVFQLIDYAIRNKKIIYIYGDYDCDGVTSTSILTLSILEFGGKVFFKLPDRKKDGYGVNTKSIEKLHEKGCDLLITVDNGIRANDAIKKAKELGIKTIILDHHILGEEIPNADVVIDLHDENQTYPYKDLAGCGLAFKIACYLYEQYGHGSEGYKYIDLAAIGTIADVVPLTDENRIIVKEGLNYINSSMYNRTSVKAIIETLKLPLGKINSMNIGFNIGPLINAPGRIEEDGANISLQLLLCDDKKICLSKAEQLKQINENRKLLSNENTEKAKKIIEKKFDNDKVIVLYLPNVEEGVVGLISGKITQHYNKPSIVFTDAFGGNGFKASGRSVSFFNLYEGLLYCSDILDRNKEGSKWGGHPMACGINVDTMEQIEEFREKINYYANDILKLSEKEFIKKYSIDKIISEEEVESLYSALDVIEPCGQDNRTPLFLINNFKAIKMPDRNRLINYYCVLGKNSVANHIKIYGKYFDVLAFFYKDIYEKELNSPEKFNVIGTLNKNYYKGEEKNQLLSEYIYL